MKVIKRLIDYIIKGPETPKQIILKEGDLSQQKYYFICYSMLGSNSTFYQLHNTVAKDPIQFLFNKRGYRNEDSNYWRVDIISCSEITKEAYDLWMEREG